VINDHRFSIPLNRYFRSKHRVGTPGLRAFAALAAAVCAVAGCATSPDRDTRGEPPLGPIPVVRQYADVVFPLDGQRQTPDRRLEVVRAEDALVRDCMKRYGFDYTAPERRRQENTDRAIGIVSAEDAAVSGYKNPAAAAEAAEVDAVKSREIQPAPELAGVLKGVGQSRRNGVDVPDGGCLGEARRALGRPATSGRQPGDDNFVIALEVESANRAEADSRLTAAFAQWRGCMSAAGYDYRDPWAPNDDPVFATPTASPGEIATAKADVACRTAHDVNGIWVAVRTAYENRLIEQNAEALAQHRQSLDGQFRRAVDVIAGKR